MGKIRAKTSAVFLESAEHHPFMAVAKVNLGKSSFDIIMWFVP